MSDVAVDQPQPENSPVQAEVVSGAKQGDNFPELTRNYQVGWTKPGQVFRTSDRNEAYDFASKLMDAGVSTVVINVDVESDIELEQPQFAPTPIGG